MIIIIIIIIIIMVVSKDKINEIYKIKEKRNWQKKENKTKTTNKKEV